MVFCTGQAAIAAAVPAKNPLLEIIVSRILLRGKEYQPFARMSNLMFGFQTFSTWPPGIGNVQKIKRAKD
jgi:hypothetical protein